MHDNSKESLSALLDGEAEELEIRRLLNAGEQSDEIHAHWQRYQIIGEVLRQKGHLDVTLDLRTGINQALDGKPMDDLKPIAHTPPKSPNNPNWIAWLALSSSAAAITLAVFMGINFMSSSATDTPKVLALQESNLTQANVSTVSQVQPEPMQPNSTVAKQQAYSQQQIQAAQQRLNTYLRQHIEDNAMHSATGIAPLAREASLPQP